MVQQTCNAHTQDSVYTLENAGIAFHKKRNCHSIRAWEKFLCSLQLCACVSSSLQNKPLVVQKQKCNRLGMKLSAYSCLFVILMPKCRDLLIKGTIHSRQPYSLPHPQSFLLQKYLHKQNFFRGVDSLYSQQG